MSKGSCYYAASGKMSCHMTRYLQNVQLVKQMLNPQILKVYIFKEWTRVLDTSQKREGRMAHLHRSTCFNPTK